MAATTPATERPPLKPSEVYRPRLGAQNRPLWQTTMAEVRAWRAMSPGSADAARKTSPGSDRDAPKS